MKAIYIWFEDDTLHISDTLPPDKNDVRVHFDVKDIQLELTNYNERIQVNEKDERPEGGRKSGDHTPNYDLSDGVVSGDSTLEDVNRLGEFL